MRIAIVASPSRTNARLTHATGWPVLAPADAVAGLRAGDGAIGRLDVLPSLDGVEDGLWALNELAARGVRVVNSAATLLATHDKLVTARVLERAGLPHPHTRLVTHDVGCAARGAVVVKPRFGSWGTSVVRCDSRRDLDEHLRRIHGQAWFRAHGALVQDLVPPRGFDLRLVVAGGDVVGAVARVCVRGEWRTNVRLGARRLPVVPSSEAVELAVEAARAVDGGLVGIDLLPTGEQDWTILEVNGAVDFTADYSLGDDVFAAVARRIASIVRDDLPLEPARLG